MKGGVSRNPGSRKRLYVRPVYGLQQAMGLYPSWASPDDVVASMKKLYIGGVTALAMGFTNYLEHFPYFRDEVLPRLAHERLRAGQRF